MDRSAPPASNDIPIRISLVAQTERVLMDGIGRGRWKICLPAERNLCHELQVSRGTLRGALESLAKRKVIRPRPGQPAEILAVQPRSRRSAVRRVGCLIPVPMAQLPTFNVLLIDHLRTRLQREGVRLEVYCGPRCYLPHVPGGMADMVRRNPHDCWVVLFSNAEIQQWFQDNGVPMVVAGSVYEGMQLPSVDTDFLAIGRHACGMMFARGHRKIALIASHRSGGGISPGILTMERGLREAFAAGRHADSSLTVVHHDGRPSDVCTAIDRLWRQPHPPTALLVGQSNTMLSTITHLGQRQIVVPRDLSVIVSHDEPYFDQIVPELTHYEWNADRFALHLQRMIDKILHQSPVTNPCVRIMPRFIAGRSLAARPT